MSFSWLYALVMKFVYSLRAKEPLADTSKSSLESNEKIKV